MNCSWILKILACAFKRMVVAKLLGLKDQIVYVTKWLGFNYFVSIHPHQIDLFPNHVSDIFGPGWAYSNVASALGLLEICEKHAEAMTHYQRQVSTIVVFDRLGYR